MGNWLSKTEPDAASETMAIATLRVSTLPNRPRPSTGNSGSRSPSNLSAESSSELSPELSAQIAAWLGTTFMKHLDDAFEKFYGTKTVKKTGYRKDAFDLAEAVLRSPDVRSLPCRRNVQKIAVKALYERLKLAETQPQPANLYISVDRVTHAVTVSHYIRFLSLGPTPGPSPTDCDSDYVLNASILEPLRCKTQQPDSLMYWQIINRAASYDRHRGLIQKDLKRAQLRWRSDTTLNRERLGVVAHAVFSADQRSQGAGAEIKQHYSGLKLGQSNFHAGPNDMIPDLIPLSRISKNVGTVVRTMEHGEEDVVDMGNETFFVRNDETHSFWNSQFLFHMEGNVGMALDTCTGEFCNADFHYVRIHWECRLSCATAGRWRRLVDTPDGYDIQWDSFRFLTRSMILRDGRNDRRPSRASEEFLD